MIKALGSHVIIMAEHRGGKPQAWWCFHWLIFSKDILLTVEKENKQ